MIKANQLHRLAGIIMLFPLLVWSITGAIFIIKPNYGGAYEKLNLRSYPLEQHISLTTPSQWLETRQIRTILGPHLLVKESLFKEKLVKKSLANNSQGWQQINPQTLQHRSPPQQQQLKDLFIDAISINPERYGYIEKIDGLQATTSTGVNLTLNWNELSIQQQGDDTRLIGKLYKIHYLQWTGNAIIDGLLEVIALGLLILLSSLGAWLVVSKRE